MELMFISVLGLVGLILLTLALMPVKGGRQPKTNPKPNRPPRRGA